MPRILTVDDSRAIRSIIVKQATELGLDVDEAEDGIQGLARLDEIKYDVVLLDVTMPNLDGPGMLAQMRARGDQTPVLMLTSESKKSVVATVMKEGVEDYILKPFTPDDIRAKLSKALKLTPKAAAAAAAPSAIEAPIPAPRAPSAEMAGRQFVDVLVVDDMENVHKKMRTLLPERVTMSAAGSAQAALTICKERVFRVMLIDSDMPDVNSSVLVQQLRLLQPHAVFLALSLRTANDGLADARKAGFDGVLYKPFDADAVGEVLQQFFDAQELVTCDDNVLRVGPFVGKEDRIEKYYKSVAATAEKLLEKIAAACFEDAILDLSQMGNGASPERAPRLVAQLGEKGKKVGIQLRIVGTQDTRKMMSSFEDTAGVPFFDSLAAARQEA